MQRDIYHESQHSKSLVAGVGERMGKGRLAYGITQGYTVMVSHPGDVYVLLTKCIHVYTLFCVNIITEAQTIHYNVLCQVNTKTVEARICVQVSHCDS